MSQHRTDVAIIGAGPVGLFAIFECGMLNLGCHVIDALDMVGGQCSALYPEKPIYDIPGHPTIAAQDLVDRLATQAAPFKPTFHLGQQVTGLDSRSDGGWLLETSAGARIEAGAVIIAAGAGAFGPNRPPIAGLAAYEGRSVFYLVRRREDLRGCRVAIAGGGDSAVDWALSLVDVAERVMLIHRRMKFRAAPQSAARLEALARDDQLDIVAPYQLTGLEGREGQLSHVVLTDLDGGVRRLEANRLLAFYGLATSLGPIAGWGLGLDHGTVAVEPASAATSLPGIYAVGDIATYPGKLKLILTGFAEAALAARAAHAHIHPGTILHFQYSTSQGIPAG